MTEGEKVTSRMTLTRNLCINKNTTGAERGNTQEQGFGALAEIVIRNKLDMSEYLSSDSLPREAKYNLLLDKFTTRI